MSPTDRCRPDAGFQDPRFQPGFVPGLWPLCNGQPAPFPGDPDPHARRCLEFLAAYYQINVLVHQRNRAEQSHAPGELLESIRHNLTQATQALEVLEDRYAPIGLYGEPFTLPDGTHRDIHFVRPGLNQSPAPASSLGSHFTIPGLDALPLSELQGPIQVTRWRHGKMDL